ncbi:MAG: tetratricopeptide repeat protein [Gammaproteobacteria bacterium]|nr:tetratricopeptide repeat protein [Gammaproteobacteria bacterium]MDH3465373.1 tetratricopeptide repeat protein [Gammaproteobacteria bacterium]
MKCKPLRLVIQSVVGIALLLPTAGMADQSDQRLDELFVILQSNKSSVELRQAESDIWAIWFDSGREDIDRLMSEAGKAVQSGDLAQAEVLYSQVIELVPEFSEGWNRRATVRYYRQDYEGSLDDIRLTLQLEPRHFGAIWGLGMILGRKRDFTGAIAAFERLLELKPNSRDARPRIELLKKELAKTAV